MSKSARHALILDLLRQGPIRSQASVRQEIDRRGEHADQATISRDFRELGLVKTRAGYVLPGRGTTPAARPPLVRLEHVYDVEVAGNLVVLKTAPGLASPTAIQLDRSGHPDLVGTLAGDDTIFLATRSARVARTLARKIAAGALA